MALIVHVRLGLGSSRYVTNWHVRPPVRSVGEHLSLLVMLQ